MLEKYNVIRGIVEVHVSPETFEIQSTFWPGHALDTKLIAAIYAQSWLTHLEFTEVKFRWFNKRNQNWKFTFA